MKPTDTPKPKHVFWLSEKDYTKVIQSEPRREILFTNEATMLWELIDREEYTVAELVALMADNGVEESMVMRILDEFESIEIITTENYLWKKDED